jgi:hypothetical protein
MKRSFPASYRSSQRNNRKSLIVIEFIGERERSLHGMRRRMPRHETGMPSCLARAQTAPQMSAKTSRLAARIP